LRHGFESDNDGKLPETNRQALEREIADIQWGISLLLGSGDLDPRNCVLTPEGEERKRKHFHFQRAF
jgi:hypothetical protein